MGDKEAYDLFRGGVGSFVASNPATVVAHVQTMCRNFSELSTVYSQKELDQGLWAAFGAGISCEQYLFDSSLDLGLRAACIQSMYLPFRDVVAHTVIDKHDSFYWMWWDMILHTFWQNNYSTDDGYQRLSTDGKDMLDAMYRTLLKILALDHPACQWSALHGLGHLRHPEVRQSVQAFLDIHQSELNDDDLEWVLACRDGKIA